MRDHYLSASKPFDWRVVQAGDRVLLASGHYQSLIIRGMGDESAAITVEPMERSSITLDRLVMDETVGVEVNLAERVTFGPKAKDNQLIIDIRGGRHNTIRHFKAGASSRAGWTQAHWEQARDGIFIRGEHNRVEHFNLNNVRYGVQVQGKGCSAGHFGIDGFSGDALRWLGSHTSISHGKARHYYLGDKKIHGDLAQIFPFGVAPDQQIKQRLTHITAKDLTLFNQSGVNGCGHAQGLILSDGSLSHSRFESLNITVDHIHGFTLSEVHDSRLHKVVVRNPSEGDARIRFGTSKPGYLPSTRTPLIDCRADQFMVPSGINLQQCAFNSGKRIMQKEIYDAKVELAEEVTIQPFPKGLRCNNPTNIVYSSANNWHGQLQAGERLDYQEYETRFCVFQTPEYGIRAATILLKNYQKRYNAKTLTQIIRRWAPPNENDTRAYIRDVAVWTGFQPNQVLNMRDFRVVTELLKAMIRKECGTQPYAEQVIHEGVAMALGKPDEISGGQRPIKKSREVKAGVATVAGGTGVAGISTGVVPEWFGVHADKLQQVTEGVNQLQTFQYIQLGLTGLLVLGVGYLLYSRYERGQLDLG